jgi:hypothetical protein
MDPLLESGSTGSDPFARGDLDLLVEEAPPVPPEAEPRRPWYLHPRVPAIVTAAIVSLSSLWVLTQVSPSKVLSDTTPTGGDMGAHVWGPAYLRDHLLPSFRLSGWTMDWYAGFPALHFYMPLPYLLIVALDVVLPYGVAFKLVAISGLVVLPVAAWAFGALARLPFPVPALMAVGATLFVFDTNWSIYGGNIYSTMAGEFAFTISLALVLVALGFAVRGLNKGVYRRTVAVLLALSAMCHLIPALAAAIAIGALLVARSMVRLPRWVGVAGASIVVLALAVVLGAQDDPYPVLTRLGLWIVLFVAGVGIGLVLAYDWRRLWWVVSTGMLAFLLAGVWLVPFLARTTYLNDMGWERIQGVAEPLFFPDVSSIIWLLLLAGGGAVIALLHWQYVPVGLVLVTLTFGVLVATWPVERLWNARLLPFWYLGLYFLAAYGVGQGARTARELIRTARASRETVHETVVVWPEPDPDDDLPPLPQLITRPVRTSDPGEPDWMRLAVMGLAALALLATVGFTAFRLRTLPGGSRDPSTGEYTWGPFHLDSEEASLAGSWVDWNFSGYEAKSAYDEYFGIVDTMARLGEDRGCGRALWEYGKDQLDGYGTPMALMLLPHWTDGCIASMEGLYFESSATVPWHFHMQSELSESPSRPMRGLEYSDFDIDRGVRHLQQHGIRYYMAFSDTAVSAANDHPDLTPVAASGPWVVYEVADSPLVEGLAYEPVVVEGLGERQEDWIKAVEPWFLEKVPADATFAPHGPSTWQRVQLADGTIPTDIELRPLDPVTVSDIEIGDDTISFTVPEDQVGEPVLVKVSYFPNWEVSGAQGPWRVAPNLMVVIPTDTEVELTFGTTPVEWLGLGMTMLGIVLLFALRRRPPVRVERPSARSDYGPDEDFWSGSPEPLGPDFSSRLFYGDPLGGGGPMGDDGPPGGGEPGSGGPPGGGEPGSGGPPGGGGPGSGGPTVGPDHPPPGGPSAGR